MNPLPGARAYGVLGLARPDDNGPAVRFFDIATGEEAPRWVFETRFGEFGNPGAVYRPVTTETIRAVLSQLLP